jgi:hypothetical protein
VTSHLARRNGPFVSAVLIAASCNAVGIAGLKQIS